MTIYKEVTEKYVIKQTSHHSSSVWFPIGHKANMNTHTTSQPPQTMATTVTWPSPMTQQPPTCRATWETSLPDFLSTFKLLSWNPYKQKKTTTHQLIYKRGHL